jgi:hypothetical protein
MGDFQYSIQLVKVARQNMDGSFPAPADWTDHNGDTHLGGIVGGAGPFNLTALLTANKAKLKVRLNGVSEERDVDFTSAADKGAVTVDDVVTAINAAGFTTNNILASKLTSGYLKIVSEKVGVQEFEDFEIIAASDAKGLHKALGIDCEWIAAKDAKSVKFEPETETGDSVSQESGRGTVCTVKEPDVVKDVKITFEDAEENPRMEVIIAGYDYDETTGRSFPPALGAAAPVFSIKSFAKLFSGGTSQKTGQSAMKMVAYPNCTGIIGGGEASAGSFSAPSFSATGTDNTVSNLPYLFKRKLTNAQYALVEVA